MFSLLSHKNFYIISSLLLLLMGLILFVRHQLTPYYNIEITPQPVSEQMLNAMITIHDAPDISMEGDWRTFELLEIMDNWQWSNPINAIGRELDRYNKGNIAIPIEQVIVQYSSEKIAHSVWKSLRNDRIPNTVSNWVTKEVLLLPYEGRPTINADDVYYGCERYYDDGSWNSCIARLRYGRYYTHLIGSINKKEISPEQFFDLVKVVDSRMQILVALDQ